ncbi:MAG TPA: UDP-N-acetylmuramoyl-L-alanine--D-glutamate ligase, partial [Verrucomicrobiae bacterium]|nr:UDP-N-acetylmuramoyl-L-alanine--D-glutamate ligase [Verrucomicrobiae bacterium]
MELKNKRVLVVGLGRSGVASAFFLQEHGAKVIVSDSKSEAQLQKEVPTLLDRGISIEAGRHGERTFRDQDLIVVSPGVPSDQPQLHHARTLGIPVIGEVELAFRFLQGKVLAITGSNGKTTTTTLVGEILAKSGKKTLVGGNIGTPVISLAGQSAPDTMVVLEVSSFQLESIEQFRPWVAAILNITPDHLDRHHTFQAYVDAKARIFENQHAGRAGENQQAGVFGV